VITVSSRGKKGKMGVTSTQKRPNAVPARIKQYRNLRHTCSRCNADVLEIDNLGKWECKILRQNPYSGKMYFIPADHGPVDQTPETLFTMEEARYLPVILYKSAVSYRVKRADKNMDNTASDASNGIIVVHRFKKDVNLFADDFVNFAKS
jgi:ribosomal protein L37AE/L43A